MITPTPPEATRPTQETDAAEAALNRWEKRSYEAGMRGSHLDSDDPRPDDGWAKSRKLEAERDALRVALDFMEANPGTVIHTNPDMSNKNWIVRGMGIKERFLTMGEAIEAARKALTPKCPTC